MSASSDVGGITRPAGGFRWTIGRKLAALAAVGLLVSLVIGGMSYASVTEIKSASDVRSAVTTASQELADLDTAASDAQVIERNMLLATDDNVRTRAYDELAALQKAAGAVWAAIDRLDLPGAARDELARLHGVHDTYMKAVAEQLPILAPIDPASADAAVALDRERERGSAMKAEVARSRQVLDRQVETARRASDDRIAAVKQTVLIALVAGLALLVTVSLLIARSIVRPLTALGRRMTEIAEGDGDLTARLDERGRDETGEVGRQVNRFIARVQELVRQMAQASTELAGSVDSLSGVSAQLAAGAEETSAQAETVSAAAGQVSTNIQTVAAGAEQMGASIGEIASGATEAARVAQQAMTTAQSANATMDELGQASAEIGSVVKLITTIAEQTNLLALNATIEAARAGEAGKGFAVVATEVKDLAQETAKATEDIAGRIDAIQHNTGAAVEAIGQFTEVIQKINDYSTTIASAVEEQTATTGEISRNVAEAAVGASDIAQNITGVATSASSTAQAATTASTTTTAVAGVVANLQEAVRGFRY